MEMVGSYPDIIIGCVGGGSNFGGMLLPFVKDKIKGKKKNLRIICSEPTSCPSLTKGVHAYDFGDEAGMAPIVKMYTLGHTFLPPPVHAGGLRYHGMAPIISHLLKLGFIEAKAVPQLATFEAGVTFARTEGIISAPETNHAIRVTIDEALKCKESGESKTILLAHSGHGHFDMAAYESYLSGKLVDYDYPEALVKEALKSLPECPGF
jgi:tryptophan synthase beta chain